MSKERIALLKKEQQAKIFEERKQSFLFLKKLESDGVNMQVSNS